MSGKNQVPVTFNWQSTDPQIGFLPNPNQAGSPASGTTQGVMSGTNTIYSQIIDLSKMDNAGMEVSWTGTPTGTISYWCSVSGAFFFQITLTTAQPAGSASGFGVNLNQYANASGTGVLSAYVQLKDLN